MSKVKVTKEYYEKDGEKYVRFSTVMSYFQEPGLVDWKVKVGKEEGNRVSKAATDIGSRVHKMIEEHQNNLPVKWKDTDCDKVRSCITAYKKWLRDYSPEVLDTETTCFDEDKKVGCTRDLLIKNDDGLEICDIKTSGKIRGSYWMQTAVQAELSKMDIKWISVLRLDKSIEEYEYVRRKFDPRYAQVFWGLYRAWKFFEKEDGK